jgi:hypothetical protein
MWTMVLMVVDVMMVIKVTAVAGVQAHMFTASNACAATMFWSRWWTAVTIGGMAGIQRDNWSSRSAT